MEIVYKERSNDIKKQKLSEHKNGHFITIPTRQRSGVHPDITRPYTRENLRYAEYLCSYTTNVSDLYQYSHR